MRRLLSVTATAVVFGTLSLASALACMEEGSASAVTGSDAKKAATYKLVVGKLETAVGKHGTFNFKIVPAKGYKVNKDYPTKLTFAKAATKVDLDKLVYKKGDTKIGSTGALTLAVRGKGKAAGTETLTANARFSICNETTCLLEKAVISVSVAVQ